METSKYPPLDDSPDAYKRYTFPPPDTKNKFNAELRAKHLANIANTSETSSPAHYGGIYNDDRKVLAKLPFDRFTTQSPPDVTNKTRIIALCAPAVEDILNGNDTWMFEDFLVMWHLFQGLTENQTWLLPEFDIPTLLEKEKDQVLLHGSPYNERKVVLNSELYDSMKGSLLQVPELTLRTKFEALLVGECQAAKKSGEHVLVIMFGHGEHNTGHFWFHQSLATSQHMEVKNFIRNMKLNTGNKDLQVTLLTTACYGGSREKNPAWRHSGSSGRATGSMYITSLAQRLTEGINPESVSQIETYFEFQRTLLEVLHKTDRKEYNRKPAFRAQNDNWGDHWQMRSGFPLGDLEKRWNSLPTYPRDPTLHVGDFLNRDPHVPEAYREEYLRLFEQFKKDPSGHKYQKPYWVPVASKRSGQLMDMDTSLQSLQREVAELTKVYFACFPGEDDVADNFGLHHLLTYQLNNEPSNEAFLQEATLQLKHRFEVMGTAQKYVDSLEIGRPYGKSIYETDLDDFHDKTSSQFDQRKHLAILSYCREGTLSKLFPSGSSRKPFTPFSKGSEYLVAALYSTNIEERVWKVRLARLVEAVEQNIEDIKNVVKFAPTINSKRTKLANVFSKTLRDLSPERFTRSPGQQHSSEMKQDLGLSSNHTRGGSSDSMDLYSSPHPVINPRSGLP